MDDCQHRGQIIPRFHAAPVETNIQFDVDGQTRGLGINNGLWTRTIDTLMTNALKLPQARVCPPT